MVHTGATACVYASILLKVYIKNILILLKC